MTLQILFSCSLPQLLVWPHRGRGRVAITTSAPIEIVLSIVITEIPPRVYYLQKKNKVFGLCHFPA